LLLVAYDVIDEKQSFKNAHLQSSRPVSS